MSDLPYPSQVPPKEIGDTVSMLGRSGAIFHVKRRGDDLLEIRLPEHPDYLGTLTEERPGIFDLKPSGGIAVGGVGLGWQDLIDNF